MPKVLCTLPNASTSINGVAFERVPAGMLSVDDLSPQDAAMFREIPGYELVTLPVKPAPPAPAAATATPNPPAPKAAAAVAKAAPVVSKPPQATASPTPQAAAPNPSGGDSSVSS